MKRLTLIGLLAIVFASCHKMENLNPFEKKHKNTPCAAVNSEAVPKGVRDGFTQQYPGVIVTTWFNKDNNGFVAEFSQSGVKSFAQFSNDGTFVKEQNNDNQEGEHHDGNKDKGCSCEPEEGD